MTLQQKEMVEELRVQWKRLWQDRVDDKLRAEGIATADFCDLFVEKGTIIHATRDFKALNFKDILEQHHVENPDRYISPNPKIGGWTKFVKTERDAPNFTTMETSTKDSSLKKAAEAGCTNNSPHNSHV